MHDWKSCGGSKALPRVRIPPSPPAFDNELAAKEGIELKLRKPPKKNSGFIEVDKFTLDDRLESTFFRDSVAVR